MYHIFLVCIMQDLARLPELFSPGMLVRCVVSSLSVTEKGKKNVKLSLNPKNVNEVLSAEALKPGMVRIWAQGRGVDDVPSPCPASWGVSRPPFLQLNCYTWAWVFSWEVSRMLWVLNGN